MISKILNEAMERYRNHLPLFLGLAGGYGISAIFMEILAFDVFSIPTSLSSVLVFIFYILLSLFSFSLTIAAKKVYLHQPANFSAVWKELFARLSSAIKIYLQFMGLIILGFLFFIIPSIFVMVVFFYAVHVRFLEEDPAVNPFRMSRKLTKRNIGYVALVGLAVTLPIIVFSLISSAIGWSGVAFSVTRQIFGALYGPFSTNVLVGTYFHLRNDRTISLDSPEEKAWLLGGWQPSWPATLGLGFGILILEVLVIIGLVAFFGEFPEMRQIIEKLRLALQSSRI